MGALVEDCVLLHNLAVENTWPSPPSFVSETARQAWIDVTLTSSRLHLLVSSRRVLDGVEFASDHRALLSTLSLSAQRSSTPQKRLDWGSVDWDAFRSDLAGRLRRLPPSSLDLHTPQGLSSSMTFLTSALQATIDSQVPTKTLSWASNSWWTADIANIRSELNRLRRRWTRTGDPVIKKEANACRRRLRAAIATAKQESWRRFCADVSDDDIWEAFSKLTRTKKRRQVEDFAVAGQRVVTDGAKAQLLADRFFPPSLPQDSPSHAAVSARVSALLAQAQGADIAPVTLRELHDALWGAGAWKAPGADRVPNGCLRHCESLLTPYLLPMFTASLRLQYVPPAWKSAVVIPVPKPEGELSTPKGYRPISLLPCLAKVLERIVTDRLTFFLETSSALSPSQYGFRRMRSTELALWNFVQAAGTALLDRRKTIVVALDIQGAYDRVWHSGLLAKLADMQVPPALLGWIQSFLSGREMHLMVGEASEHRRLMMGVPQGSPLSPILFLVFIDDLLTLLSPLVHVQAFADDVLLWWHAPRGDPGGTLGQQALDLVGQWAIDWKVTFNPAKCHPMVISRFRKDPPLSLSLQGTPLTWVPHIRYLGVWVDSKLTWRRHISVIARQGLTRLRLIHRGVSTLWGLHPSIVRRLVRAAVLPAMFYAAPIWSSAVCHLARLRPLDRVLRLCGICILGLLRTVSGDAARALTGLLPAEFQIRQRLVEFYLRTLEHGRALVPGQEAVLSRSLLSPPLSILCLELRQLTRTGLCPFEMLQRVERQVHWTEDPASLSWTPPISFLDRETAVSSIRQARDSAPAGDLWIFTDGSVDGSHCGAAAILFQGAGQDGSCFSTRFDGFHSSTQTELVAIRLGCDEARRLGSFSRITIVSDSQPALLGLRRFGRGPSLTVAAREAVRTLEGHTTEFRIWWTPSHAGLLENDLVDAAAKAAAQDRASAAGCEVPLCKAALKTQIAGHYLAQATTQWHLSETGRDLHSLMPCFARDVQWTRGLSRPEVALLAQFLSGHYVTGTYLRRFGHPVSGACRWCAAPIDDRAHRLFDCPRFDLIRQQLQAEIRDDTQHHAAWTWEFLATRGLRYLLRFLRAVQRAAVPSSSESECSEEDD